MDYCDIEWFALERQYAKLCRGCYMSWRARENFLKEKKSRLNPEVLARWTELEDYFTAQVELSFITGQYCVVVV